MGGWAEQPARFFDIVDAIESEMLFMDAQEMEKRKNDAH